MSTNNEDPLAFLKAEPERPAAGRPKNELSLVARPYGDDRVFRIDRIPMPWITIIAVNLLCVALCYGLHWFLKHAGGDANVRSIVDPAVFAYVFPPALALFLCVGLAALSFYFYGGKPWLVYHKATRRVELPRHKVSFDRPEIVRLEYIVHASLGHRSNDLRWSEPDKVTWSLYLVTCRDGRLQQWSLLKSPYIPLDYLLPPLTRETRFARGADCAASRPWTRRPVKEMPATPYATGELPAGSFAAAAAAVESADGSFATAAPVGPLSVIGCCGMEDTVPGEPAGGEQGADDDTARRVGSVCLGMDGRRDLSSLPFRPARQVSPRGRDDRQRPAQAANAVRGLD